MEPRKQTAEITAIMTAADDLSVEEAKTVHRRLIGHTAAGFIEADPVPADKRGTLQFNCAEACAAVIFSTFTDLGFVGDFPAELMRIIKPPFEGATHIRDLPAAIRRGEVWTLEISLLAQRGSSKKLAGGFITANTDPARTAAGLDALAFHGVRKLGLISLDVTALCRPVVQAFEG